MGPPGTRYVQTEKLLNCYLSVSLPLKRTKNNHVIVILHIKFREMTV